MQTFELVAISCPEFISHEASVIEAKVNVDFSRFHLRKPQAQSKEILTLLVQLPPYIQKKTVVHLPPILETNKAELSQLLAGLTENNLPIRGLHGSVQILSKLFQNTFQEFSDAFQGLVISTSCHNTEEISKLPNFINSVFLSPIFPSISKVGHHQTWDFLNLKSQLLHLQESQSDISRQVIALGGVTLEKLPELASWGFQGAAMLGALNWENK